MLEKIDAVHLWRIAFITADALCLANTVQNRLIFRKNGKEFMKKIRSMPLLS